MVPFDCWSITLSAVGTVFLKDGFNTTDDYKALIKAIFEEFNLDQSQYEIAKYTPSYINGKFKVWARFERKKFRPYDEEEIVARYETMLSSLGSIKMSEIKQVDSDNILVINLADVHWNKLPFLSMDGEYLEKFENTIYEKLNEVISYSKKFPISRAVITIGHDFFQTNDGRGTTKKGTPVSHIMEYKDMFDSGVRILSRCVHMVAQHYMVDAYYVLANHDNDAGWHASRELKLAYKNVPHVNFVVDKIPFHYVEWGSTLVELIHENIKGGKSSSNMSVTAREAWGRTKYHYSIGGHLHGEYTLQEKNGIVTMGSRALSDTDEWHYLEGYLGNIRGIQAYVFNKDAGNILTINANL